MRGGAVLLLALAACGSAAPQATSRQLKEVGEIDASLIAGSGAATVTLSFAKPAGDSCVLFTGMKAELDGQAATRLTPGGWVAGPAGSQGCARPSAAVGWADGGAHHLRVFD